MSLLRIVISLLPVLVHAQNGTDTSTSENAQKVGWVSAPDKRGTSDIRWSCFAIFLVCTWKCTHLNIPSQEESEAGWLFIGNWLPYWPTRLWWRVFFRKLKWMVIIALAPEIGVTMAVNELWQARELRMRVSRPNFTLTHAFYALMGGFIVAIPSETEAKTHATDSEREKTSPLNLEYYSIMSKSQSYVHSKYQNVHPVVLSEIFPSITRASGDSSDSLHSLCFPVVTEAAINNQSKSDPFTKSFAVLQCTWLIVQSIARTSQGLRLTELELATLSFTMCAFLMYGFWWYKPFDGQQSIPLLCLHPETQQKIRSELRWWDPTVREDNSGGDTIVSFVADSAAAFIPKSRGGSRGIEVFYSLIFHITAITFSGIHVIAWNWDFPSQTIQILWRVFSIIATGGAVATVIVGIMWSLSDDLFEKIFGEIYRATLKKTGYIMFVLPLAYVASRVGLIVMVFYCFSAMPASVYQSPNWNLVFPHFS